MSCSFSINPICSPDGTPPVMTQWVVGHLGTSVECGRFTDRVTGANSSSGLRLGWGGLRITRKRPTDTGPFQVQGRSLEAARVIDGYVDSMTDNVGVDREVNAGDTITWTTGVEAGEMSMTIGESPNAKYVWGFLSGVKDPSQLPSPGLQTPVVVSPLPPTSGPLWVVLVVWLAGNLGGREAPPEWPGVGILRSLGICYTCTSILPLLPWGRHPMGVGRGWAGRQQFPDSLWCLFRVKSASRGGILNSQLYSMDSWCWLSQCWRKPCGLGVCQEHPKKGQKYSRMFSLWQLRQWVVIVRDGPTNGKLVTGQASALVPHNFTPGMIPSCKQKSKHQPTH